MESIDERKKSLIKWLHDDCGLICCAIDQLLGDASGRRYFRISNIVHSQCILDDQEALSYIAMDAPAISETNHAFVSIANGLRAIGIHTPKIIQADVRQGFLLMTDFGDATLLKVLNPVNAEVLYQKALKALATIQACTNIPAYQVPPFTEAFMWQEWAWHKEWFLGKLLSLPLSSCAGLEDCYAYLMKEIAQQPQVFMHRDYHSGNLMLLSNQEIGVLDFQDAFIGPVTYDLVSLLRDCYIAWPETQVKAWVIAYWSLLHPPLQVSQETFLYWFDHMSIQRHLKALFTFARKHIRDSQSNYLTHVPRTLHYILSASAKYPALAPLHQFYLTNVIPAFTSIKVPVCAP